MASAHLTVAERLALRSLADANTGCVVWQGSRDGCGYGRILIKRTNSLVHRISWSLAHGEIPDGLHVLHRCDNPPCLNVAHLFLGTHKDNMNDMVAKGRQARTRLCGVSNGCAKLMPEHVRQIRGMKHSGRFTLQQLGDLFGVSESLICMIVRGKRWQELDRVAA